MRPLSMSTSFVGGRVVAVTRRTLDARSSPARMNMVVRGMSQQLHTSGNGRFVRIVEVSPRDGLQNLPGEVVSTQTKVELIKRLRDVGLRNIEVGSFVRGDRIPQMADSRAVLTSLPPAQSIDPPRITPPHPLSGIPRPVGGDVPNAERMVHYPVLVPNMKGMQGLLELEKTHKEAGGGRLTDEIAVFVSATEAFSKANNNASIDKVLDGLVPVIDLAKEHGYRVRGYVSCVMTDPYSGITDPADVVRVSHRLLSLGVYELSLGDTTGEGNPGRWVTLWNALKDSGVDMDKVAAHCHDTFSMSLPSLIALLPLGLRTIDSSVAGLGGCPYSPGATGNVPTEDVVYMLHTMGYETGIDLEGLVGVGDWLSKELGIRSESRVGRAIAARKKARIAREQKEAQQAEGAVKAKL